jgi:hypothetical protein
MPSWVIALLLSIGVTAWSYNKLAHVNGNANPRNNLFLALFFGGIVFFIVFTFLNMILNFDQGM